MDIVLLTTIYKWKNLLQKGGVYLTDNIKNMNTSMNSTKELYNKILIFQTKIDDLIIKIDEAYNTNNYLRNNAEKIKMMNLMWKTYTKKLDDIYNSNDNNIDNQNFEKLFVKQFDFLYNNLNILQNMTKNNDLEAIISSGIEPNIDKLGELLNMCVEYYNGIKKIKIKISEKIETQYNINDVKIIEGEDFEIVKIMNTAKIEQLNSKNIDNFKQAILDTVATVNISVKTQNIIDQLLQNIDIPLNKLQIGGLKLDNVNDNLYKINNLIEQNNIILDNIFDDIEYIRQFYVRYIYYVAYLIYIITSYSKISNKYYYVKLNKTIIDKYLKLIIIIKNNFNNKNQNKIILYFNTYHYILIHKLFNLLNYLDNLIDNKHVIDVNKCNNLISIDLMLFNNFIHILEKIENLTS